MKYIRSPAWDGFWIGGGLGIGVVLMIASAYLPAINFSKSPPQTLSVLGWPIAILGHTWIENAFIIFFLVAIVFDTAHNMSPIVLTWTYAPLRRFALARWRKFILLSGVIMAAAAAIGAMTSLGWTDYVPGAGKLYYIGYQWRANEPFAVALARAVWDCVKIPLPLLALAYAIWQLYHFGSQNFGVVMLYSRLNGWPISRAAAKWICVLLTSAMMLPAYLFLFRVPQGHFPGSANLVPPEYAAFLMLGSISVMHWLVSIGLGQRVIEVRWRLWLPMLLLLGCVGFLWQEATPHSTTIHAIPWIISLRFGLGLVHFMYDGWIWHRDSPAMRAIWSTDLEH